MMVDLATHRRKRALDIITWCLYMYVYIKIHLQSKTRYNKIHACIKKGYAGMKPHFRRSPTIANNTEKIRTSIGKHSHLQNEKSDCWDSHLAIIILELHQHTKKVPSRYESSFVGIDNHRYDLVANNQLQPLSPPHH